VLGRARPHARTKTLFSFKENSESQKVPEETFWLLFFSDAHVIGKYCLRRFFALVLRTSRFIGL
jgi:hypothetical protein